MKYLLTLFILLNLASCTKNDEKLENTKNNQPNVDQVDENHDEHHHEAPNGGVLTEVGEHAASLEWLIEDNQFKVYIFDGCAEKPIRLAQKEIKVTIKTETEKELILSPVTNKLTGEKPGDSNTFTTDATGLATDKISSISVHYVQIQGIDYKNVNLKVN